jgi:short-subunit dehydrogenase
MAVNDRKTALITGASSGIGYELVKCFAQDGHDVILVARSEDELNRIAENFQQQYGIRATVIAKDLFDPDAAWELYDEVSSMGIEINYLVNDAGQGVYGKFVETDLERELEIISLMSAPWSCSPSSSFETWSRAMKDAYCSWPHS